MAGRRIPEKEVRSKLLKFDGEARAGAPMAASEIQSDGSVRVDVYDIKEFPYDALPTDRKRIRLLRLLPGVLDSPQIDCEMFEAEFDERGKLRQLPPETPPEATAKPREKNVYDLQPYGDHEKYRQSWRKKMRTEKEEKERVAKDKAQKEEEVREQAAVDTARKEQGEKEKAHQQAEDPINMDDATAPGKDVEGDKKGEAAESVGSSENSHENDSQTEHTPDVAPKAGADAIPNVNHETTNVEQHSQQVGTGQAATNKSKGDEKPGKDDQQDTEAHDETTLPEAVEYEAMSWRWGDEERGEYAIMIKKDGILYKMRVSQTLGLALKYLRTGRDRILWIDAICINQKDFQERSAQVAMMSLVYSAASQVCVWIGEDDEDSTRAIKFINNKITTLKNFDKLCTDKTHGEDWKSLLVLMQRDWFSRRWVVQEIALAQKATVYCGPSEISWDELAIAVELFVEVETATHRLSELMRKDDKFNLVPNWFEHISELGASLLVNATGRIFRDYEVGPRLGRRTPGAEAKGRAVAVRKRRRRRPQPTLQAAETLVRKKSKDDDLPGRSLLGLEYLVTSLSIFDCGRPHDSVYALVAIARDASPFPPASLSEVTRESLVGEIFTAELEQKPYPLDYSRPFPDVCKEFIHFCIKSCAKVDPVQALDILCRPWAKDWRVSDLQPFKADNDKRDPPVTRYVRHRRSWWITKPLLVEAGHATSVAPSSNPGLATSRAAPTTTVGRADRIADEAYYAAFPNGAELVDTSGYDRLCGLRALELSIRHQLPERRDNPTVDSLLQDYSSPEMQESESALGVARRTYDNHFSVDQLGALLYFWGRRQEPALDLQLGYMLSNRAFRVDIPASSTGDVLIVWITFDTATGVTSEDTNSMTQYSGLRAMHTHNDVSAELAAADGAGSGNARFGDARSQFPTRNGTALCQDLRATSLYFAKSADQWERAKKDGMVTSKGIPRAWFPTKSEKQKLGNEAGGKKQLELPSWVAKITEAAFDIFPHPGMDMVKMGRKNADPLVGLPQDRHRNYSAGQSRKVEMKKLRFRRRPRLGHYSLYVQGFRFDKVKKVSQVSQGGAIPAAWLDYAGWPDARRPQWPGDNIGEPPGHFWRTLVADRGRHDRNPPYYYSRACKETFMKGGMRSNAVDTTALIYNERNSIIAEFCRRVQAVIWNRALIQTRKGKLGLVSPDVRPGDLVCIIYGCTVPVILRKAGRPKRKGEREREHQEDCVEALVGAMSRCAKGRIRKARYQNSSDEWKEDVRRCTAKFNKKQLAKQTRARKQATGKEKEEEEEEEDEEEKEQKEKEEAEKREAEEGTARVPKREGDAQSDVSPEELDYDTTDESGSDGSDEDDDADYSDTDGESDKVAAPGEDGVEEDAQNESANRKKARQKRADRTDPYWSYTFLGQAYIHGMMDGEAVRQKFYKNKPDHVFELR